MVLARRAAFWATLAATMLMAGAGFADQPQPWQMGLQEPATPVMEEIVSFHNELLWIISIISAFVLALLVIVIVRFNAKSNPTPSKTAHNTVLEIAWTVIPVLILVYIATRSFPLIYYADRTGEPEMTLKAIGYQWYWSYEYPDHGNVTVEGCMKTPKDGSYTPNCDSAEEADGDLRLLETLNRVVVPVDTNIRLLTTANDVIHAWAMPAFGVKIDAVPGRTNESWFKVTREGVFYGQCSELCGLGHAYMPIVVEAVAKDKFDAWVKERQAAMNGDAPAATVAQIDSTN